MFFRNQLIPRRGLFGIPYTIKENYLAENWLAENWLVLPLEIFGKDNHKRFWKQKFVGMVSQEINMIRKF